jgi:small subunit ribosomal protein S5
MARERREKGETDSRDNALVDFVVKIRRSACVVKGGRRFSFNALVVVGDRRGRVAYGYGKANEVPPAVEKAIKEGEGNVQRTKKISLRGNTIPHRIIGKYGASRVIMVPAGPGTGVKAGPGVREVLQACGVTNILTKVHGSTNPINLVKATIMEPRFWRARARWLRQWVSGITTFSRLSCGRCRLQTALRAGLAPPPSRGVSSAPAPFLRRSPWRGRSLRWV